MDNNTGGPVEGSNTLNFGDENHDRENSSELVERFKIAGTPFTVIADKTQEKEKHFITWGKYRISEPKDTQELALNTLIEEQWNIIPIVIAIMLEASESIKGEDNGGRRFIMDLSKENK